MQHPNSGISATMNVIIIKNLDWKSILTGIIRKKAHKGNLWYKQLLSQTAQEICKQLDKAWKSFYVLKRPEESKNQIRPVFKQGNIPVHICRWGFSMRKVQTS